MRRVSICTNPTTEALFQPNQFGFAPMANISKPSPTEIRLKRILKYDIRKPGSVFMTANAFEEIVASCHPGCLPHRLRYSRAPSVSTRRFADRQSYPAQAEWIAAQNRRRNQSRSPRDWHLLPVDRHGRRAR